VPGPREISRFAWGRYRRAPFGVRLLMTLRPLICPLDVVAEAVPRQSAVLDIGCGAALLLRWLVQAGRLARGVGVDVSMQAIEAAAACATPGEPLEFVCRGPDEPWPHGDFDCVTLVDVLHHVPPSAQRPFIGRLRQVGPRLVIVKDIDPRPRWKAWMNALHDFLMTRRRVHLCPMDMVRRWLEEEGFQVARAERVDRLWYSHYLIVARRPPR